MARTGRPPLEIEIGKTYGNWTVLERAPNLTPKQTAGRYYRCSCKCGRIRKMNAHRIFREQTSQCLSCHMRQMHEIEDLVGQEFGKWKVISRIPVDERRSRDLSWFCRCKCGRERPMAVTQLKRGGGCRACIEPRGPTGLPSPKRLRPYESLYRTAKARIDNRYDRRTHEFSITYEEFLALIEMGRCHYCQTSIEWATYGMVDGKPNRHGGHHLDRKDNAGPYSLANVVPCCTRCNFAKGARYSYAEWFMMTACFRKEKRLKKSVHAQERKQDVLF